LDHLATRFILLLPSSQPVKSEEVKEEPVAGAPEAGAADLGPWTPETIQQLFSQIQMAFYLYSDYYKYRLGNLPGMKFRTFCQQFFNSLDQFPSLTPLSKDFETHFAAYQEHVQGLPVCGVILLNREMTEVVLVKGTKKAASWSFPKGKKRKDESDEACASREAKEELGVNVSAEALTFLPSFSAIQHETGRKSILFVVPNTPKDIKFTLDKKELSEVKWWPLSQLPGGSPEVKVRNSQFYLIAPFVHRVRAWVQSHLLREVDDSVSIRYNVPHNIVPSYVFGRPSYPPERFQYDYGRYSGKGSYFEQDPRRGSGSGGGGGRGRGRGGGRRGRRGGRRGYGGRGGEQQPDGAPAVISSEPVAEQATPGEQS
jgi:mRNA-decapping enzyme subunit 2